MDGVLICVEDDGDLEMLADVGDALEDLLVEEEVVFVDFFGGEGVVHVDFSYFHTFGWGKI